MSGAPPASTGAGPAGAPPVILPVRSQGPRREAGCSRWAGVGCGVAIIALAALILGSFLFFDRGVQWAVRRAADRIEERMDPAVPPAVREHLLERLEEFCAHSGEAGAAPRNGAFLERAGRVLADGRVSAGEAAQLGALLEGSLQPVEPAPGSRAP